VSKSYQEISWNEFRESGLLWFINMILHTFGMVICVEMEVEEVERVYPARTTFRGFPGESNSEGYAKVESYMRKFTRGE
jgi:hypothetical protein